MARNERVVWDEGMLLSPQHFQQWDRHQAAILRRSFGMLQPHGFGLTRLDFEHEALLEGKLGVRAVAGILPGGLPFDAPEVDPAPQKRSFKELFDPRAEGLGVHLALPQQLAGGAGISDSGIDGNRPTPFVRRTTRIHDDARPAAEREIAVAVPNLRILFDGEVLDGHDRLQIGIVRSSKSGGFVLAPEFVPPCLWVAAAPRLVEILGRLVGTLGTRSDELTRRQQRTAQTSAGAASLWLLHTLNGALPELLEMQQQPRAHPQQLHRAMARLAAQLCTFAGREHPRTLPLYDHEQLTATFAQLDERLTQLLDLVITSRCQAVPLDRPSPTMLTARLQDRALLDEYEFYLAVAADIPKERIEREFPSKVKIGSLDGVHDLVTRMVPGLPLQLVVKPPDEVPVEPGRAYFLLDKGSAHWRAIAESLSFGFHVPPDFHGLQLDLLAAKVDSTARK